VVSEPDNARRVSSPSPWRRTAAIT
jgi:hypothetical protein